MSERIARPSFYEGQVLRAADLGLGLEYGRGQMARHDRYLHTPGIATGLELKVDKSTGITQVKLSPGMAIDATGRQIVVDREETLSSEHLDSQGALVPADTDANVKQEDRPWHPVFLVGRDENGAPPPMTRGCGSANAQPNRTDEAYDVRYGRPSEESDDPPTIEVGDGPESTTEVRVLIGFVQWDGASGFADAKTIPKPEMSPPYAGARADEVVARGGSLALRADLGTAREKQPAIVLDGDDGGEMRFGLQDKRGVVKTVFSVNAAGNVTVTGKIKSPFTSGVYVESGTIWDGMTVPLPSGVTQKQVDDGKVAVHVAVTPRRVAELRPPGKTGTWFKEPFECRVDGRRVFVRDRWFDVASLATLAAPLTIPAACNYMIVASVSGGTS
jgi:hypothetical protein